MRLLIDGDIIAYRVAWATQMKLVDYLESGRVLRTELVKGSSIPEPLVGQEAIVYLQVEEWEVVAETVDRTIANIQYGVEKRHKVSGKDIYLTDSRGNYRKQICPDYKANRKGTGKPVMLNQIMKYLRNSYGAEISRGQEADDAMGIAQTNKTIIVTTDKDLNMVPGLHYNYVKDDLFYVSPEEGRRFFWKQVLTGDTTDNIQGIPKVGPKRAEDVVRDCKNEKEYCLAVFNRYLEYYNEPEKAKDELIKTARLINIRQKEGEIWEPPIPLQVLE